MKYGKPVINTNLGTGVNFVSINNKTGLTVEPCNVEELAKAINVLLTDEKLRNKLGQNARKRVEELFNIEKIKDKYIKMYPQGKYNALAQYYLANSYYQEKKYPQSLEIYSSLLDNSENPNVEFSLQRASSIAYDMEKYEERIKGVIREMMDKDVPYLELGTIYYDILS